MFECKFRFKILTVLKAQESHRFQNGDEPYFVFFGLRSRFRVLDSTRVFWSGYLNDHWTRGSREGSSRKIPGKMGVLTFPDVMPVDDKQLLGGTLPEVIGVVGIAMESDGTEFETFRRVMRHIHDAIHGEICRQVEEAEIKMDDPHPDIIRAIITLKDSLNMMTRERIKAFLSTRIKTDDLIGVQARICLAGDHTVKSRMPGLEILETKNIHMDFSGNGASYRVSGFMDIAPEQSTDYRHVYSKGLDTLKLGISTRNRPSTEIPEEA
jgi:hypothetical protein